MSVPARIIAALVPAITLAMVLTMTLGPATAPLAAESAAPLRVNAYYGDYQSETKDPGRPAKALRGPVAEDWHFSARATRPYRFGVLFPHLKDPYWVAVNHGITERAMDTGVGFELEVIAMVVIGGTALGGGRGTILGTVLGVLILRSVRNSMPFIGVPALAYSIFIGAIILGMMALQTWLARRQMQEA